MEQNNENGTPSSSEQMPAASGYADGANEAGTIFVPRESLLGGNQSDAVLAEIAKNRKLVEDCVASLRRIEEAICEIKETEAQKRQAKMNNVAENVGKKTMQPIFQELNEVVESEEKSDEEKWARIKALETQVQALWDMVRPSGRQKQLGETETPPRPDLAGDGDGAPPPSVPPVEIKSGPEFQVELKLEVPDDTSGIAYVNLEETRDQALDLQEKSMKPGTVPPTSSSKPEKKDGASGTLGGGMDKKALLTFMDLLESQDRGRDQKKSELENVGVPVPAPIDKNLIAQDLAVEDSDDEEDDEDDEGDFGSDASPTSKKMKLSAEATARKNPSEKKELANSEVTKGKGVSVPIPSPAVAVVSGARPSLLTGRSPSNPASPEGLSPASVGTSGRGAFSSRRPFSFGNNDNDNKPKLHKTCEYCGNTNVDSNMRVMLYHAYTNMDEFLKHQEKNACKPF